MKKPVRERQVPYDFTCMWNLMSKINQQSGDRLMDTKNRLTAVRGAGVGGRVRRLKGLNKKKMTHGHRPHYGGDCQSVGEWGR